MLSSKTYRRRLDEQSHELVAQGNHAAYLQFQKRYRYRALYLVYDLIDCKYKGLGIVPTELVTVCNDHFPYVVKKFNPWLCSFYTFWRKSVELQIADYVNNTYFSDKSKTQSSISCFDDDYNENIFDFDCVAETDENIARNRLVYELRRTILAHKEEFEHQEFMMLLLTLDGYTMADFEHTGINSQSTLYLTFKKAITKLDNIMKKNKKN